MNRTLFVPLSTLLIIVGLFACQRQPEYPAEGVGTVLSADSVSIAYEVHGRGAPVLVFVHGWSCDRTYWNAQVRHFSQRHTVVAIDLAGHGESGLDRDRWTIQAYGEDVAAVVKKLALKEVVLIGHSMGGPVMVEAATKLPGRVIGLVGADTFQDVEEKMSEEKMREFLAPMEENFVESTKSFVRQYLFSENTDSALVEKIVADMASAPPEVALNSMRELFSYEIIPVMEEVRLPVRCINTDKYPINVEAGRRHAASFEVKLMPGVGHFVMMEDPEAFNRHLEEIIAELKKK